MVNDNISPEERLFKIIQQEKSPSPAGGNPGQKRDPAGWLSDSGKAILLWKGKLISVISGLVKKTGISLPEKPLELQLKKVNIILSVILLVVVVIVTFYAVAKYPNLAKITSAAVKAERTLRPAHAEIEKIQSVNYYTEDAKQRNIFSASQRPAAAGPAGVSPEAEKSSVGDLKLQGIAWSDTPKVIIQAGKDNKMYILKEGQTIGLTGIRVKTILRNKVILTSGDKDIEL